MISSKELLKQYYATMNADLVKLEKVIDEKLIAKLNELNVAELPDKFDISISIPQVSDILAARICSLYYTGGYELVTHRRVNDHNDIFTVFTFVLNKSTITSS